MNSSRPFVLLAWLGTAALTACGSEPSSTEYLERARSRYAADEIPAATIETRNAVKGDAENAEARLLLGELLLRTGDAAGAEKELRKARELGATDVATRPLLARALLGQHKLDELVALAGDGLEPADEARLLATRALGWFATGELPSARQDAERALELDPASSEAALALARFDAAENDLEGATERTRALLEASPEYGEGWEFLGDLERAVARRDEAAEAYGKAIEHADVPLSARIKRAQVRVELDDAAGAREDLDALGGAGARFPEIELARGQLDLRDGDMAAAQIRFEEALTIAPDFAPAAGSLALTHLLLGNVGQAEQYGKQLLAETDGSDQARRLLGAIRLEDGRHALAEETIEPNIGSGRFDPLSARILGTALLKQDKFDEAIDLMVDVIRITPQDVLEGDVSPLVLTRKPSRELLDEAVREPSAELTEPGADEKDFLDADESRIVRILELVGRGELEEGLAEAEALAEAMPDSAAPHNLVGRLHLANEALEDARAAFERALEVDDASVSARQLLAEIDLRQGDVEAARERLERAVRDGADSEVVLLQLARLEAQASDETAMLKWIERARDARPGSVAPALLLARYHATNGAPERALDTVSKLDERRRDRPDVLQIESASLLLLERHDEALSKLERLVALQPDVAQWRYLRARARAGTNDREGAMADLTTALELDPAHAPAQLAMANADIQRGRLDAAFGRVESLRELIPGTPELEQIEARYAAREAAPVKTAASEGNGEEGRRIGSTEEVLAAARELWTGNRRDEAVALLDAWLEAHPSDLTVRLTLANSYIALERTDDAVAQYEAVLETDAETLPDKARLIALNNLAWYLRESDSDRAVDYAKRAVEADPDNVAALDTLAMIYLGRGDAATAKTVFDRATEIGVDDPSILFHGAQIEAALGNEAAARALLAPLVDDGTDFPESAEAKALLDEIDR